MLVRWYKRTFFASTKVLALLNYRGATKSSTLVSSVTLLYWYKSTCSTKVLEITQLRTCY
jgi:hypothetical protein